MFIKTRPHVLAATIAIAMGCAQPVAAQERYSISQQSLIDAVPVLSEKYDRVIVLPEGVDKNLMVRKVTDSDSLVEALNAALQGSRYEATEGASGAIVIIKKPAPAKLQQHQAAVEQNEDEYLEEVVVVGSYIQGANIAGTLPISTISSEDIAAFGATDGAELLRMLPQSGDIEFNETNFSGGVNTVRGDIASVNLRSVGTGNTLMLINGRRMAVHPGWQNSNSVPVVTYNANTIPTAGVSRLEVMRDGASALYGADAVAGVINTVMIDDYEGTRATLRYGTETTLGRKDVNFTIGSGSEFADGKGYVSVYGGYSHRNAVPASEYKYAVANRTPFLEGTAFEGNNAFDNRTSIGGHGYFDKVESGVITLDDGTVLTNSSGRFHVQPTTNSGCLANVSSDICIDNGYWSYGNDNAMYHDLEQERDLFSERHRANLFSVVTYDFGPGLQLYGELGAYFAETKRRGDSARILTDQYITISKDAYWNPFGRTTLSDGSVNPNRIANTTNIAAGGLDLVLRSYRVTDTEIPRQATITNETYRALIGLNGQWGNWDFDTAAMYSTAISRDKTTYAVSVSKLQDAINQTTPDAYNPFCGACNSPEVVSAIYDDLDKKGDTELALVDFKLSNNELFSLPGGNVGFASGIEFRYESFSDDRDVRLDGTEPYVDAISGAVHQSNSLGDSPTNDLSGDHTVLSAFAELAVPLVSPQQAVPLVQAIDLQAATRFEHFSDFGSVVVPRIAMSWALNDVFMVRASWSKGFRAPNLVQTNASAVQRQASTVDYARCEAMLQKGIIEGNYTNCKGDQVAIIRESSELESETSYNRGLGLVITPAAIQNLTFAIDYWEVVQRDVVGVLGAGNQSALDQLYLRSGSQNENVVRAAPTEEDFALFEGTDITPVGEILRIYDPYMNLNQRKSSGIDYTAQYINKGEFGKFTYNFSAAHLKGVESFPGNESQVLINAGLPVSSLGQLVGVNGRPEWKANASVKWNIGNWTSALFWEYVGNFEESSAKISVDGIDQRWKIDAWQQVNAYVSHKFKKDTFKGLRVTMGVKNLFDKYPPLADESFGTFGRVHSISGRYLYTKLTYDF
ncbi:TonB-dependent receptor domain-containing protein [Aestuariibacter sp. A3R04]|uniref:TonB-dependent receptor domain-containing protein n=1 Tax=Aestuariibacter sp. A3R04 TaxID=2841571 RepID=UPI001C099E87|nr:TonB-dependent receptor [Aestuariibacter sp. A3R04]MBU3023722.1 TonB-dependent receptor [Aestuariibacter sp. A3R04]